MCKKFFILALGMVTLNLQSEVSRPPKCLVPSMCRPTIACCTSELCDRNNCPCDRDRDRDTGRCVNCTLGSRDMFNDAPYFPTY